MFGVLGREFHSRLARRTSHGVMRIHGPGALRHGLRSVVHGYPGITYYDIGEDIMPCSIQLSLFVDPDRTEDELLFARQLGMDCVYTWLHDDQCSYEYLAGLRQRIEAAGLRLYNAGNIRLGKSDQIHLALPGRDAMIEQFCAFIRDLGRAGIHTTTFTW